ncbi:ATP-binding protein [Lawsonibacter celer]|uniref:ATP-binding protein n=1 Tax=Lawsonibacter celer TaxID=2986526 RepID=UPI001647F731
MLFSDYSCISRNSVQILENSGIYRLLGLSWASIVVVLHSGRTIIEAENDCGGLGHDLPSRALEAHRAELLRRDNHYGTLFYEDVHFAYFLIRRDTSYNVYYYFAKKGANFSDSDLQWFQIYNKKSYSALVVNNELIQTHEYLSSVIDGIDSYVLVLDLDKIVISYNAKCKQLFARDVQTDRYSFSMLRFERMEQLRACIQRAISTERRQFLNGIPLRPPEQDKIFSIAVSPLHNSKKAVCGVILICNDMSKSYLVQLQNESIEKYKFISDIALGLSHDIKNPLMNIRSCTGYLLQHRPGSQEQDELLQDIGLEVDRINAILNQMLSYCSVSTEDTSSFVNINDILSTCIQVISRQKLYKDISIHADLAENLPPLTAKSGDLYQVFLNIILNAVQAIESSGVITISTRLSEQDRTLLVDISDNGPGIPPEHLQDIFSPFYTTKPQGTGVGLYLSHRLLQHYHAGIEVRSDPGVQTTFALSFPVR